MIMHHTSDFQILASSDNGYIGICTCCEQFNLVYKNILLTFQEESLFQFCDWLVECRNNPEYQYTSYHGRNHVYPSPLQNFFLMFSNSELAEVEHLYNEVQLVLEARKLVKAKRN